MSDGAVTSGPAIYPQPVFQVRVQDGWIEVRSGA
jgi:nitrite reductase/ring-hydroxylating ferredoxin subunit